MPTTIDLDREFRRYEKDSNDMSEYLDYLQVRSGSLRWADLLQERRIVLLAELGSGKSEELKEQHRLRTNGGQYSFHATLRDIARHGLGRAIGRAASERLEEWRSGDEPAWFFLDSIDEATQAGETLDTALRSVNDAIHGRMRFAHIVISARPMAWDATGDKELLDHWLPIPGEPDLSDPVSPDEVVIDAIRRKPRKDDEAPAPEEPLIVRMIPLDESRIRLFLEARAVKDTEAFLHSLRDANLQGFATRPIDLDWLQDYWRKNQSFGSFKDMIDNSLRNRFRETRRERRQRDRIEPAKSREALERVGASLVLSRSQDLTLLPAINDERPNIALTDVLPDWPSDKCDLLIDRAVFEPASLGYVRLHNDNDGSVRGYLAACWLRRMMKQGCSREEIHAMLFCNLYGEELVVPSMCETAAWLAIWEDDFAREIVRREPFVLINHGDPGSLASEVRQDVFQAVVDRLATGEDAKRLRFDSLRRFSAEDLSGVVRTAWNIHKKNPDIRELLLHTIEAGPIKSCQDIVIEASFGAFADWVTEVLAARALFRIGDSSVCAQLGQYAIDHAATASDAFVWEVVESLFPTELSVEKMLTILSRMDHAKLTSGLSVEYRLPPLISKMDDPTQLESLVRGLFDQLDDQSNQMDRPISDHDEQFAVAIDAAASRLLELSPRDKVPLIGVEAMIRVTDVQRYGRLRRKAESLTTSIVATPERRREAFWHAFSWLSDPKRCEGAAPETVFDLSRLGYRAQLEDEDFDWLLADARNRPSPPERRVAADGACLLKRRLDIDPSQDGTLIALGNDFPDLAAVIDQWSPRHNIDTDHDKWEKKFAAQDRENKRKQKEVDESWTRFARELRGDPDPLSDLKVPGESTVDGRLYDMWKLLDGARENRSQYSVDDVQVLVPMVGPVAAEAFSREIIAYWRQREPIAPAKREPKARGTMHHFDCMATVGVSLEAAADPRWTDRLSASDAEKAAILAVLELNGFPTYMDSLARVHPEIVGRVLWDEISLELADTESSTHQRTLSSVSHSGLDVSATVATNILNTIRDARNVDGATLDYMLRIVVANFATDEATTIMLEDRFAAAPSQAKAIPFLVALYDLDASAAINALDARLTTLDSAAQTKFMVGVLSSLFNRWDSSRYDMTKVSLETLERLVQCAYRTVRYSDDNVHPSGKAYSPDDRDDAESARSALLKTLVDTAGPASYAAILRVAQIPGMELGASRFKRLARERAELDSEHLQWPPGELYAFEQTFEIAPANPIDLQNLASRRIRNISFDLVNRDFEQGGRVLAGLKSEREVQYWVAERLERDAGRSYSVEREPEVASQKKPDIRIISKAPTSNSKVQVEIKVVDDLSLSELQKALEVQLIGQYLRDRFNTCGILLLVYQKERVKGWKALDGGFLPIAGVANYLSTIADRVSTGGFNAPRAKIEVIDVTRSFVQ